MAMAVITQIVIDANVTTTTIANTDIDRVTVKLIVNIILTVMMVN